MTTEKINELLLSAGYNHVNDWYVDGNFKIKFNKRNITTKSEKGTIIFYINPKNVNETDIEKIIRIS